MEKTAPFRDLPSCTFVLGGAASGKSDFAENLLLGSSYRPVYIATAHAYDTEMRGKIRRHQMRRGPQWRNVHAPLDLAEPLRGLAPGEAALLDCATMWLSNTLEVHGDLAEAADQFALALSVTAAPVIIVSNEIGQGIVPMHAQTRAFREAHGRLNIALAAKASCVVQVIAGLPNILKGSPP